MHSLHHGDYFLRPPSADDVPSITEAVMESTATVGAWMSWATKDYSQDDAIAWVRACEAGHADGSSYEFGIFANSNGRLVGAGGLNQFNKVNNFCNLGYWVRASAQRHGAATAAVAALRDFAFVELRLSRVEIVMAVNNDPSFLVARKSGATLESTARNRLRLHGKPTDAYVFSIVPASGV